MRTLRLHSGVVRLVSRQHGHTVSRYIVIETQHLLLLLGSEYLYRTIVVSDWFNNNIDSNMKKSFSCPQCDYKATKKYHLQTHIKSIHEGQTFACAQCDYRAKWKRYLQTHIKSVHEGQKFKCTQCDYTVKKKTLLQKHKKSAHGKVKSKVR